MTKDKESKVHFLLGVYERKSDLLVFCDKIYTHREIIAYNVYFDVYVDPQYYVQLELPNRKVLLSDKKSPRKGAKNTLTK